MSDSDFESTANRMRNRARSSEHRGGLAPRDMTYIKHCTTRVGTTTLIFTCDAGQHGTWFADPAHDRCWHLSISGCDDRERDLWLRAFFGDDLSEVWGQRPVESSGRRDVWHWRMFCDRSLAPIATNEGELIAAGLRRACEFGVFRSTLAA